MSENIQKYPCPCCGYYTIDSPRHFDLCPVCFWEDDPLQFDDPTFIGGPNEISLREARKNYRLFGAMSAVNRNSVRPPHADEKEP